MKTPNEILDVIGAAIQKLSEEHNIYQDNFHFFTVLTNGENYDVVTNINPENLRKLLKELAIRLDEIKPEVMPASEVRH